MSLAIKVLQCNAKCQSCYENRIRENVREKYNIKAIIATLKEQMKSNYFTNNPTIHGGEPLLLRARDLERLFKIIFEKYKNTGIQSNLLKLKDRHIKLFKKYKTHMGISLDGSTIDMNQGRGYDPKIVLENMKILKQNDIRMSTIIILRKYNSLNIDELIKFIKMLKNDFDIVDIRTNPGIVFENELKEKEELTNQELSVVLCRIADLTFSDIDLNIQPIKDVVDLLMGNGNPSCSFTECDPYHTTSEVPIFENGMIGNCLKSGGAVDGIVALKTDTKGYERYKLLKQLPQKHNGCLECHFWLMCKGGCPGAGVDNDWRNRTRFCEAYKILFIYISKKIYGLFPNIYLLPDFYPNDIKSNTVLNSISKSTWKLKHRKNIKDLIEKCSKTEQTGNRDHGDKQHGDRPHGDSNDPKWVKQQQQRKRYGTYKKS